MKEAPETISFRTLRADEIEMRVGTISQKGSAWLLYKTARVDMDLLDETVGPENWENDYKVIKDNLYCGIGIRTQNVGLYNWAWKWDCGTESNTEAEKGEASDSFKRAGFRWGIGRELYTSPFIWLSSDIVPVAEVNGKYRLKDPFIKLHVKEIEYDDKRRIKKLIIADNKENVVWSHPAQAHKAKPTTETKKTEPVTKTENVNEALEQWIKKIADTKSEMELINLFQQWKTIYLKGTEEFERLTEASTARRLKGFII